MSANSLTVLARSVNPGLHCTLLPHFLTNVAGLIGEFIVTGVQKATIHYNICIHERPPTDTMWTW